MVEKKGKLKSGLLVLGVDLIKLHLELFIVLLAHVQVVVQLTKDFELELVQVHRVYSSCELKGLVVVVEVVLKLGRQKHCRQYHLVHVQVIQTKLRHFHVVSVDVYDRHHQAFGRKLGILV